MNGDTDYMGAVLPGMVGMLFVAAAMSMYQRPSTPGGPGPGPGEPGPDVDTEAERLAELVPRARWLTYGQPGTEFFLEELSVSPCVALPGELVHIHLKLNRDYSDIPRGSDCPGYVVAIHGLTGTFEDPLVWGFPYGIPDTLDFEVPAPHPSMFYPSLGHVVEGHVAPAITIVLGSANSYHHCPYISLCNYLVLQEPFMAPGSPFFYLLQHSVGVVPAIEILPHDTVVTRPSSLLVDVGFELPLEEGTKIEGAVRSSPPYEKYIAGDSSQWSDVVGHADITGQVEVAAIPNPANWYPPARWYWDYTRAWYGSEVLPPTPGQVSVNIKRRDAGGGVIGNGYSWLNWAFVAVPA